MSDFGHKLLLISHLFLFSGLLFSYVLELRIGRRQVPAGHIEGMDDIPVNVKPMLDRYR